MSPTHNNVKSLSNRIFRSVLTFTLIVLFVFGTVMSAIFYITYERDAEGDLSSAAQNVAASLGSLDSEACEQALSQQFSDTFLLLIGQNVDFVDFGFAAVFAIVFYGHIS